MSDDRFHTLMAFAVFALLVLLAIILIMAMPASAYSPQQVGLSPNRALQDMYAANNVTTIDYFNHSSPQYLEMLGVMNEFLEIYRR